MNEINFWQSLRADLLKVPLKDRRHWSDAELLSWWNEAQRLSQVRANPSLAPSFDIVKRRCSDLIGTDAWT